ncbi:MAG: NTP transferase domain-containing protein [Phycisphaerae bacterium]
MSHANVAAVILAAGKSTRMRTELCKVLHPICGRPMLAYVIDACRRAGVQRYFVIVGYGKDQVISAFSGDAQVGFVEQREQRGTGHAVLCAREQVADKFDHVVVLCGDAPLIRAETITQLVERHLTDGAAATLATAVLPDPTGYGRILRDSEGRLRGIVEQNDCTPEQRQIREINPSYYCFNTRDLFGALENITPNNAKNEYYLTDALAILINAGKRAAAITAVPPEDVFGINSRAELAMVNRVMRDRINAAVMDMGVTIVDPQSTWIDARATIGQDTVIHPFSHIGPAAIGRNCVIGPFARLSGGAVADGAVLGPAWEAAR